MQWTGTGETGPPGLSVLPRADLDARRGHACVTALDRCTGDELASAKLSKNERANNETAKVIKLFYNYNLD